MNIKVSLVEQDMLILPEHLSSPLILSGVRVTRSLFYVYVLYIVFVLCLLPIVLSILFQTLLSTCCIAIYPLRKNISARNTSESFIL